jgi:hypothetical protein
LVSVIVALVMITDSYQSLGVGRGRHTLELETGRSSCSATIERYDVSLAHHAPESTFVRTRGYRWFVDDFRAWESKDLAGLGFAFRFTESSHGSRPGVFQTTWTVAAPTPFILGLTALPASVALIRRVRRRQRRPRAAST